MKLLKNIKLYILYFFTLIFFTAQDLRSASSQADTLVDSVPRNHFNIQFSDIEKWINEGKIKSVEDLLDKLPYEMRDQMILVHDTRSSFQHASREIPRMILSTRDSKLILAFAGSAGVKGGSLVEVIEFNEKDEDFKFKSIDFSKTIPITHNPTSCVSCHISNRPIWDTYPHWPGVYGGLHSYNEDAEDSVRKLMIKIHNDQNLRYRYIVPTNIMGQLTALDSFHVNSFDKNLHSLNNRSIAAAFAKHPQWNQVRDIILDSIEPSRSYEKWINFFSRIMPSGDFSTNYKKMGARASRRFDRHPILKKRTTILKRLKDIGIDISETELEEAEKTIKLEQNNYYREKILRDPRGKYVHKALANELPLYPLLKDGGFDKLEAPMIAFMDVLTKKMGVSGPSSWSLSFRNASYSFTHGEGGLGTLHKGILKREAECAAQLERLKNASKDTDDYDW